MTKDIFEGGKKLPVVEEFYTLQGEGVHTGKAAYFIRLGGCDIGCYWCDTRYSWNPDIHPLTDIQKLISNATGNPSKAVLITGGEPLMWNLNYLCIGLKDARLETFLETSGAYPLSGIWDWICLSPKKKQPPQQPILDIANELKVIISDPSDFDWAITNEKLVSKKCHLLLQPEWSVREAVTPMIIDFIKNNPRWRISLQAHKYMKIP